MKVTVSSSLFASHLQMAGKVLAKKNPMTILDCFLIEVQNGTMSITASNAENSIITRMPLIEQNGEGCMCINAETLLGTMKEIPEQPLILDYNEKSLELRGKHSSGEFHVVGQNVEAFPPSIPVAQGNKITIPSKELLPALAHCLIATVEDEIMPFKRGVFFDVREDSLIMVATDGRKLVKIAMPDVKPGFRGSFILPMKIAGVLKSVGKKGGSAEVAFDQQRATINMEETTVYFRLVEARYPNYNSVIPKNKTASVSLDRLALIGALKRVGVFCNQSNNFIKFELRDGQAVLTGSDSNFATSAEEFLPCDYDGVPFSIGFGYTYFVEILNNIETANVTLELLAPERPCVCKPEGTGDDLLMLLMPMKIEE